MAEVFLNVPNVESAQYFGGARNRKNKKEELTTNMKAYKEHKKDMSAKNTNYKPHDYDYDDEILNDDRMQNMMNGDQYMYYV